MLLWLRFGRQTGWKWKRNNLHFLWQNKNKTNKLGYAASQPLAVCFFYLSNVSPSPSSHPISPLPVSQLPPDIFPASLNRQAAIKAGWFYPQSKCPKSNRGHCVHFKRDKTLFFSLTDCVSTRLSATAALRWKVAAPRLYFSPCRIVVNPRLPWPCRVVNLSLIYAHVLYSSDTICTEWQTKAEKGWILLRRQMKREILSGRDKQCWLWIFAFSCVCIIDLTCPLQNIIFSSSAQLFDWLKRKM